MNKKSTPFKLKGSPFKQTKRSYNEAKGNNPDMVKNVFTGFNDNKSGSIGVEANTGQGTQDPTDVVVINERTVGTGSISNADNSTNFTIANQSVSGTGDILNKGSDLPSYKQAWDQDIDNIRTGKGYGGDFQKYYNDMEGIEPGDKRDVERENARKTSLTDSVTKGGKDTKTGYNSGKPGEYEYGTKGSSYESRKNVRTTKSNANTIYNQKMGKIRNNWRGGEKNEDGTRTIDGKSYKNRGEYVKTNKRTLDNARRDKIIKTAESEVKNSQNASSQNKTLGQKVRGKERFITEFDKLADIKAAQKSFEATNFTSPELANIIKKDISKGKTGLLGKNLNINSFGEKKSSAFKQKGYSFGGKK